MGKFCAWYTFFNNDESKRNETQWEKCCRRSNPIGVNGQKDTPKSIRKNWKENSGKSGSRVLKEKFPDQEPEEIKVLDIGTGPGFFAVILAEQGYQVTAVDYTEEMLKEAKKNAGTYADKICWKRMDAQNLEFASEQFDVVVSRNLTWNLEDPKRAYAEWYRVLKHGGLMLNFDANWYGHLFEEGLRKAYEEDRRAVEAMEMEDHYTCTNIDWMEEIARKMPLSPINRPRWDCEVLKETGFAKVEAEENMGKRVWSLTEQMNYHSTPMFCVAARRA